MKIGMFTDIHYGARGNGQQHLEDCGEFIDWVCDQVVNQSIEALVFLGDWFESRESIMLHTLDASYRDTKKLNDLGIPVYMITGNHDLRYKTSREISSTLMYGEFDNFVMVKDSPLEVNFDGSPCLIVPFLFDHEYGSMAEYINSFEYVFGHFEFKNFVVTGKTVKLEHGPDHQIFNTPKRVFSGHFHKRQIQDNVVYIGNPFPTNYGDVMDTERGMAVIETSTNRLQFFNFTGPSFYYSNLLSLMEDGIQFPPKSNVKCYIDVDIPYSEVQEIRKEFLEMFGLREFIIEDTFSSSEMAKQDGSEVGDVTQMSTEDAVIKIIEDKLELLNTNIRKDHLIKMFRSLGAHQ